MSHPRNIVIPSLFYFHFLVLIIFLVFKFLGVLSQPTVDQPTVNQPTEYTGGGSVTVAVGVSDR